MANSLGTFLPEAAFKRLPITFLQYASCRLFTGRQQFRPVQIESICRRQIVFFEGCDLSERERERERERVDNIVGNGENAEELTVSTFYKMFSRAFSLRLVIRQDHYINS